MNTEPVPATRPASPRRRVGEHLCIVQANMAVNADYRHLRLATPPAALAARPGQFFHLLCPAGAGGTPFLRRPMSVYQVNADSSEIAFLYKVHGEGTRALTGLRPGDVLDAVGPLGHGFTISSSWRRILLVGRGVGLATLAPLASEAVAQKIAVTAILSIRRPDLVMSVAMLEGLGADVHIVHDEDGSSEVGAVERLMEDLMAAAPVDAVFTCGSARLLALMQRFVAAHGLVGEVALEQQMACGLSMCFCCVRPFRIGDQVEHRRVCWEGPVFDLMEAMP